MEHACPCLCAGPQGGASTLFLAYLLCCLSRVGPSQPSSAPAEAWDKRQKLSAVLHAKDSQKGIGMANVSNVQFSDHPTNTAIRASALLSCPARMEPAQFLVIKAEALTKLPDQEDWVLRQDLESASPSF